MPIREEDSRLVDDTRSFNSQELTDVWEWMDSFDRQPLRARDEATLERSPLIFSQDQRAFRGRVYSIAKCSDGREVLGSVIGVTQENGNAVLKRTILARLRTA